MNNKRTYDAVIIGAGHNGLVAAFYLAKAGLKVAMVEARDTVGGLAVTDELFPRFKGNVVTNSAHSLEPRILADMRLGDFGLQFKVVEPSSLTLFSGGRRVVGWQDRRLLSDEIARVSTADVAGHVKLLSDLNELAEQLDVSFFGTPPRFSELAHRLRTTKHERLFQKVMFGSATELVSEYLESDEMRSYVGSIPIVGTNLGPSDPWTAYQLIHRALHRGSASVRERATEKLTTETGSAPWSKAVPVGGMGAVTQAMACSVQALGVEIRLGSPVAQVKCWQDEACGVVLADGTEIDATTVVSNAHPLYTLLELVPEGALPADFRQQLVDEITDGCMSKVYLAIDGAPEFACARSRDENEAFLSAGFRTSPPLHKLDASARRGRTGEWHDAPIIYGVFPSAVDPTLAPDGHHLLSLSVSGSPYRLNGGWKDRRDQWTKHIVDTLSEYITNLPAIVIDVACKTPDQLEDEFGLFHAELTHGFLDANRLFGWGAVGGRMDHTTPVAGLYLCGVGTWPGNFCSGIPGFNAATRVIDQVIPRSDRTRTNY